MANLGIDGAAIFFGRGRRSCLWGRFPCNRATARYDYVL